MAQASRLRPQSDPFAAHCKRLDPEKLAQTPAISQEGQLSNTLTPMLYSLPGVQQTIEDSKALDGQDA